MSACIAPRRSGFESPCGLHARTARPPISMPRRRNERARRGGGRPAPTWRALPRSCSTGVREWRPVRDGRIERCPDLVSVANLEGRQQPFEALPDRSCPASSTESSPRRLRRGRLPSWSTACSASALDMSNRPAQCAARSADTSTNSVAPRSFATEATVRAPKDIRARRVGDWQDVRRAWFSGAQWKTTSGANSASSRCPRAERCGALRAARRGSTMLGGGLRLLLQARAQRLAALLRLDDQALGLRRLALPRVRIAAAGPRGSGRALRGQALLRRFVASPKTAKPRVQTSRDLRRTSPRAAAGCTARSAG
jgi:hypothetical protein